MGCSLDFVRIQEKEKLPLHVVGVVQNESVAVDDAGIGSDAAQPELPGPAGSLLLSEYGLHLDAAHLRSDQHSEIPHWNAARQESRLRKREGHVADLDPLQQLAFPALVEHLKAVRPRELAGLVVVQIHEQSIGNGSGGLESKLDIGLQLGDQTRLARDEQGCVAGPEQGPVAAELGPGAEADGQVGQRRGQVGRGRL